MRSHVKGGALAAIMVTLATVGITGTGAAAGPRTGDDRIVIIENPDELMCAITREC